MTNAPQTSAAVETEEILKGLRPWVESETPSNDGAAVNRLVDIVEAGMQALGARINRISGCDGFGDILLARSPWGGHAPGILILGHLDTVHPIGTLANVNPFRREGDYVYGPGIFDMKAGAYLAYDAFRRLVHVGCETPLPLTFLYVPDEEIGSPTSRPVIEYEAQRHRYVLVGEPAHGGRCCTARKGVLHFDFRITGRSAHAGSRHHDGRSANRELARQVVRLEDMTDYERGITVNVGLMGGGSFINVVPAEAWAKVCVRAPEMQALEDLRREILAFQPFDPDVALAITGEVNRPVFERLEGTAQLYAHARRICRDLGFDIPERASGGGSDGNFTAALGVPTLDGLGAEGNNHHTPNEYVHASCLVPRVQMWMRLLKTLE